jgi:hypothetical protein
MYFPLFPTLFILSRWTERTTNEKERKKLNSLSRKLDLFHNLKVWKGKPTQTEKNEKLRKKLKEEI